MKPRTMNAMEHTYLMGARRKQERQWAEEDAKARGVKGVKAEGDNG